MSTLGIGFPVHAVAAFAGLFVLTLGVVRLWVADPSLRTRRLATAAAVCMTVPFSIGAAIYPAYREHIKPELLVTHPRLALAFESKEHLAAMGLCCVLGGAGALVSPDGRRAGRSLLTTGWLLCITAGAIGVVVTWWPTL
jgi:hypothetical protein